MKVTKMCGTLICFNFYHNTTSLLISVDDTFRSGRVTWLHLRHNHFKFVSQVYSARDTDIDDKFNVVYYPDEVDPV